MILDPNPTDDSGPHYEPVTLTVQVILDRDAFPPDHDGEAAALQVLLDAVQELNEATDLAHSVTLVEPGFSPLDAPPDDWDGTTPLQ